MFKFLPDIEEQIKTDPPFLPLLQLSTSYWISRTLASALELNLFTIISEKALTREEIKKILSLQDRTAQMLLTAAVALGLLQINEEDYSNSPLAEEFLVEGKRNYIGEIVKIIDEKFYPAWGCLTEALQSDLFLNEPEKDTSFLDFLYGISSLSEKPRIPSSHFFEFHRLLGLEEVSRNLEENPLLSQRNHSKLLPLIKLATSFWPSKILGSSVELGLFTELSGRKANLKEAAKLLGLENKPTELLMTACLALGLVQIDKEEYSNTPLTELYLVRGRPYYFGEAIKRSERRLYHDWMLLTQALKTNRPQQMKPWEDFDALYHDREEKRLFLDCIHSLSIQTGKELGKIFDFSKFHQLLDVGGGSGAFCIELLKRYPHLKAVLFDLPPALGIAHEKIYAAGYSKLIETYPGDFFKERLPQGSDVILLSLILHNFIPEEDKVLLQKCYEALPKGGALVIVDLMIDDDKTGPLFASLQSLNLLLQTESGFNYTWRAHEDWMSEVGFEDFQRLRMETTFANGVLIGYKG